MENSVGKALLATVLGIVGTTGAAWAQAPLVSPKYMSEAPGVSPQAPQEDPEDVVSRRIRLEESARESGWAITPMRPNYILPFTYVEDVNAKPWEEAGQENVEYDDVEIKFQLSLKLPVWKEVWSEGTDLYMGYTQVSVWQAYNSEESSPFRDTNYEPEFFLSIDTDYDVFGLQNRAIILGAVHQSNGRGNESLSRSWNRVYANFVLERGNLALSVKPWVRLPEDEEDDNNPSIEKYYGYGELRAAYKLGNHVFAGMGRNNLRADGNKGALELNWSYPLGLVRGFVQYFAGYGETLIDYDHSGQRIGVGVMLSEWL